MKNNYIILVVAALFFFILSCQKELDNSHVRINSSAETAKQEFSKLDYRTKLSSTLNDTADLVWEPIWNKSYEKTADSIQYIYTPLKVVGITRAKGSRFSVNTMSIAKLLLIKKTTTEKSFYIQTFISSDTAKNKMKNFTDKYLEFSSFSGSMILEDINSDEFLKFQLKEGTYQKPENKKLSTLNSNQMCSYETICDWTSQCNDGVTVTFTVSPASEYPYMYPCPYPYSSMCQTAQWTQVRSYVKVNCSLGSPGANPLPPPVPDTGGGPLTPGDNNTETLTIPYRRIVTSGKFRCGVPICL